MQNCKRNIYKRLFALANKTALLWGKRYYQSGPD